MIARWCPQILIHLLCSIMDDYSSGFWLIQSLFSPILLSLKNMKCSIWKTGKPSQCRVSGHLFLSLLSVPSFPLAFWSIPVAPFFSFMNLSRNRMLSRQNKGSSFLLTVFWPYWSHHNSKCDRTLHLSGPLCHAPVPIWSFQGPPQTSLSHSYSWVSSHLPCSICSTHLLPLCVSCLFVDLGARPFTHPSTLTCHMQ